tara:strand:+ start:226 stop:441 length:216 start_codon:yes stop_codon:yes gene_type:complete
MSHQINDQMVNQITENFDEMPTSDLCIWLETHRDTDNICDRMYIDLNYVAKKWIKESLNRQKRRKNVTPNK